MKLNQNLRLAAKFVLLILISLAMFSACSETDPVNPIDNPTESYNKYLVAGSYGDLITYEVDKGNKKFKYFNETTNKSDSGSFVLSTNPKLTGVYEITSGSNFYYGVELPGEMYVTSAPSGNNLNSLCFGLTAEKDLSTPAAKQALLGKYLWIDYNDLSEFEWGGFEMLANGTFTWQIGPDDDADFDINKHFAGGGSGTWAISTADPARIVFNSGGIITTGTINDGDIMLIDNGPTAGFTAGIKYPDQPIDIAEIGGNYKGLDVTPERYIGVGNFALPSSGSSCDFYFKYHNNPYVDENIGTMNNFRRSTTINNAFVGESEFENEMFYTSFIVLPSKAILFFTWSDEDGMVSYGVGSKID
jgi:hypothetical protein